MSKRFLFWILLSCIVLKSQGQEIDYDSVRNVFNQNKIDSLRLKAGLELARYYRFNAPSEGVSFADASINLAKKLQQKKYLGEALHYKASAYYQMAQYDSSEKYNRQALAIRESIHDEKGMAGTLTNLGQILADQGRLKQGFEYLHRAEKIYTKLKDDRLLGMVYNSLGNLYYGQKVYKLAYEYHYKAFRKRQQLNDEYTLIYSYNNLGHTTFYLYGPDSARKYYEEGARRARLAEDPYILVQSLNNLGDFYLGLDQFEKARKVLQESIQAGEGTEFESLLSSTYMNYARVLFYHDKKTSEALKYAEKGYQFIKNSGMVEMTFGADDLMAKIYSTMGNYPKAYKHLRSAFILRDSLTQDEIRQQMTELEAQYENDKKKLEIRNLQSEKKLKDVELAAKNSDLERKSTLLTFFISGSVLLVLLALAVFTAYRRKKRDGELINAQKKRVEEQNRIILHQKAEVEEKQKEIIDSINYAQRIQRALLATESLLQKNLPEHFVLFQPKDIVSGDFYWATKKFEDLKDLNPSNPQMLKSSNSTKQQDTFYLAVCDSTGHGVPGAFMSLLNISFLNEAITERNLVMPNEILQHVRTRLIDSLRNENNEGGKDGMDGVLICLQGKTVYASCANNPLVLIRNNELIELTADRMPVGKSPRDNEPFTLHTLHLQPGDCLYAFTDGFADQFGGEQGKKFKYKNLLELIKKNHRLPLQQQKEILHREFVGWQGKLEQLDDVLIMGIRMD